MRLHPPRIARPACWSVTILLLLALAGRGQAADSADGDMALLLPDHRLQPRELAVIVNDADPLSVRIGEYYVGARGIPVENLLHVRFRAGRPTLPAAQFRRIREQIEAVLPASVRALALTWAAPYRVDCMSITSAFTFGFDPKWCSEHRCAPTAFSPLFDRTTRARHAGRPIRPTMAIAATGFDQARKLIDRGIASDGSNPEGTAWLLSTSDRARNVRAVRFGFIARHFQDWLNIRVLQADSIRDEKDILFYFTGLARVPHLETLGFLPGAVADHLTSSGGKLTNSRQMSSLRWLEAGATGSYGTVVEPCSLPGKFPDPLILMEIYTHGRTLLESYWMSVQQPGEGIFVGEPLAAPFDGYTLEREENSLLLTTRVLLPGRYRLYTAPGPVGPYRPTAHIIEAGLHQRRYRLPLTGDPYLKLVADDGA